MQDYSWDDQGFSVLSYLCKAQDGTTKESCCCENVSGANCSDSEMVCGTNTRVEVMTGDDAEVVCGEFETGDFTVEEFNIILEYLTQSMSKIWSS